MEDKRILITPKESDGSLLVNFISESLSLSLRKAKSLIEEKCCRIDGKVVIDSRLKIKEKQRIVVDLQEKEMLFPLLYEAEECVVIDKPSGVLTAIKSFPKEFQDYILVHRLDKETSGALLLAKNKQAEDFFLKEFKERRVDKIYVAVIEGHLKKTEGTVSRALEGKSAITLWKVWKKGLKNTLLLCQPITGRTHQIRKHVAGMGHPIIGDIEYGSQKASRRILLHAYSVAFNLPNGERVRVKSALPEEFKI